MEVKPGYKKTEVGVIPKDWRIDTLGNLTILMTNGFVGTATRHYTLNDTGVLYIQGYNVEENSFNFNGIKFVTEKFHRAHMKSCLQTGDLLTVQTGDIGLTTIVPEHLAGSNCHALIISRLHKKSTCPTYISYYLNSNPGRLRLKLIETGTTMKHLNVGDMLYFSVPLPPTKAEQKAIATVLSDADALIESLDQLIEKKRNIKQGAMQELLTGKKRLPGFETKAGFKKTEVGVIPEDWEVQKIKKVAPLQRGFDLPKSKLQKGIHPVVYSNGIENYHSEFMVKGPGIVTGRSGTIGAVHYVDRDFWPHNTSLWVTNFINTLPRYIYYLFQIIDLTRFKTGSGVPTLNRNDVHDSLVSLPPTITEQRAIATALSDMDAEITALEKKQKKARLIKQGMMQQLLTGKIRLV